jgi:hypothetical protein
MPNNELPTESEELTPRRARDEAQLILGQIHGVISLAVNEVDRWLEKRDTEETGEPELTADDIRRGGAEVHAHFGTVHAALNTGEYDEDLVRVGLTGAQGQMKRKGLLPAIARFCGTKAKEIRNYIARLRGSLRWSATLIGSITAALKKEIDRVPGAAAAGEAIKEFIEVLLNATEPPPEGNQTPRAQQNDEAKGGAGRGNQRAQRPTE